MSFNQYFNSRFAGCRTLAHAFDQHRNRDVTIYQIPGRLDCVGVSDGVDRWIAPVVANIFSVDIEQLFRDLQSGVQVKLPLEARQASVKPRRRALLAEDGASPSDPEPELVRRRPSKSETPVATPRRRVLI